jgi:hypothetical protein
MAGKKKKNYSQSQQGNKQINTQIKKDSLKNGALHRRKNTHAQHTLGA